MAQIYLTGAVSDWDDPFAWHDSLSNSDKWSKHNFVNPYTLNEFELGDSQIYEEPEKVVEPALESVRESDGLLVYWDDDAFLVGTAMEIKEAFDSNVPIVLWYDGWKDNLSPWLLHTSKAQFEDKEKALKVLLTFAGDESAIVEDL